MWDDHRLDVLLGAQECLFRRRLPGSHWQGSGTVKGSDSSDSLQFPQRDNSGTTESTAPWPLHAHLWQFLLQVYLQESFLPSDHGEACNLRWKWWTLKLCAADHTRGDTAVFLAPEGKLTQYQCSYFISSSSYKPSIFINCNRLLFLVIVLRVGSVSHEIDANGFWRKYLCNFLSCFFPHVFQVRPLVHPGIACCSLLTFNGHSSYLLSFHPYI